MKKRMGDKRFDDNDEVKDEINNWLKEQKATFYEVKKMH